jgi:hypothetical protein
MICTALTPLCGVVAWVERPCVVSWTKHSPRWAVMMPPSPGSTTTAP